ncbi:MAG: hypothetical protein H0T76_27865 [Nannocystis sp.]|nr:hypothetical protein [Nannocystis sp.]MBA3550310.1 hypothetical protein [Nannocystis sp.]
MTPDLRCYGDDIQALADLVPDVDLRSPLDTHTWFRREWQPIAETLGFAQQLAAAPTAIPTTADRAAAMTLTGLAAFERSLYEARISVTDPQARTQSMVLQQLTAAGHARGELWRVTADPTTLSTGACYAEGGGSLRAFYPDTAPGYFGEGWPGPPPRAESACGWTTPLVLHLGTFPWVYSSRLEAVGPGLRWTSSSAQPALEGLYVAGSLMEPATNLRQDARQVAAIFRHFTAHTASLLARLPRFPSSGAETGRLYRRGHFLHVHQGSLHITGLDGPRGLVAAPAYNYVLRRFACFFAIRRAALRALSTLPADVQQIAATSADPCMRQHVEEMARAG